jgi:exodeoxyribonuclease V beta subunit
MSGTTLAIERVPLQGVSLIEASAGTGKTYTLAALVVRLILESELHIDEILVVTYTRAATAELRVRVRRRIVQALAALEGAPVAGDSQLEALAQEALRTGQTSRQRSRLQEALRSFDEAAIFTIHGFCQRVLRRHAFESGVAFEAELSADRALLLEEVVCDFWARELSTASAAFVRALEHHDFTPASLTELVQRATSNPELVIVPEGSAPELAGLETAYLAARARAAQLWAANGPAVLTLLSGPALKRNRFKEELVRSRYRQAFERLATSDAFALPEYIEHVTPAQLAEFCKKDFRAPLHPFFDACAALCSAADALRSALDQHVYRFVHRLLDYSERELARRSEQQGRMGFEDLLLRLRDALDSERGPALVAVVRSTYRAALIDEFQDTDPLQLQVFRRIFTGAQPDTPLLLIGDPKQAIYAFRGADIFAYLAARDTADRVLSLSVNRRSDPSLVRACNAVFTRARMPFVFPEITYQPVSAAPDAHDRCAAPAFELLFMPRPPEKPDAAIAKGDAEEQLPARIATEIAQLLAAGKTSDGRAIEPRQIAVLCRTNAQAMAVQAALRVLRIPAVLDGDASVFDSPMAEELGRWLWAMLEPSDPARVRAALATHGIGRTADELLALDRDEAAWDGWVARFHELQELWQTRGFMRALHALCDACDVAQHLLALPDGERRYTDLWHLAELLHEEALRTRKGPHALLEFYRRVRAGEAQRSGMALEDVQVRLESDAHAVTLTTIHKSKGLEFPIVFCPYLWALAGLHQNEKRAPLFHDPNAGRRATLHLPRRDKQSDAGAAVEAEREAMAEHARLLYVALTRAKHKLFVVWGGIASFHESALSYVLHQAVVDDELASATAARAKALGDAGMLADLEALATAADGCIGVRPLLAADPALVYQPEAALAPPLAPRTAADMRVQPQRISSFSSLASSEHARDREEQLEGELDALDHDAGAGSELDPNQPAPSARVALADFPAGASFGHLIHAIYETADFQVGSPDALRALTESALSDYGVDVAWTAQLSAAIFDSLHTSLAVDGGELPSLASVALTQRKSELEFVFPVADDAGELTPARLANVLRAHAETPAQRSYAERLAKLRFAPLRGFLRGFIDVVVEHAGRYYVIDYKSNRLGDAPSDYRRERIEHAMQRHHYPLQALLYSVAVHRYLSRRVRDYDYERCFGGVYYLFVRGMSPAHELGSGVLFDRPRRPLIDALSRALAHPGGGA